MISTWREKSVHSKHNKDEANDKQMLASNDNGVSTYEIVLLL